MNLESLTHQLISDEGVRYHIYLDHLGFPTFGIGHKVVPSDPEYGKPVGWSVSPERVYHVFSEDLNKKIQQTRSLYGEHWNSFPGEVKEILVNMCFNLGKHGLSKFKNFRRALERRDWNRAADEGRDSLWYRQVPRRAERLMSRLEEVCLP